MAFLPPRRAHLNILPMASKSLTGASVPSIILSILARADSYGYDIIQQVHDLSDGEIEWAAGSLYPVLHRMKANGQIEDYWVEQEGSRKRRFYRVTPKGHKALVRERDNWLAVHGLLARLWSDLAFDTQGGAKQ